jgi:hypothetical protein
MILKRKSRFIIWVARELPWDEYASELSFFILT